MIRAASQRPSICDKSGPAGSISGLILNSRAHRTRTSATDVRELTSMAIDRTSPIGRDVNRSTDATGPREAIARSGTIAYGPPRRYSIDGIRPMSIAPSCRSDAHVDGTSKRSRNRSERSRP